MARNLGQENVDTDYLAANMMIWSEVGQRNKTSTTSTHYIFDDDFDRQQDGSLLNSILASLLLSAQYGVRTFERRTGAG